MSHTREIKLLMTSALLLATDLFMTSILTLVSASILTKQRAANHRPVLPVHCVPGLGVTRVSLQILAVLRVRAELTIPVPDNQSQVSSDHSDQSESSNDISGPIRGQYYNHLSSPRLRSASASLCLDTTSLSEVRQSPGDKQWSAADIGWW